MNDVAALANPLQRKLRQLETVLDAPSPNEADLLGELEALSERLSTERLQLAVIGQFKRGKSSLLNALIGEDVLPSGVLPVTAIATFLERGDWRVTLQFDDGHQESKAPGSAEESRAIVRMYVSEAGNPRNLKHIRQVHVQLHAPLLDAGIVLIDTPGIGSTLEHNTEAAVAALPAADVALFVLSPDPPITQVEIDYLNAAREHAARLLIVLNKCDLLSEGERAETLAFIRDAVRTKSGIDVEEIHCVSARAALVAGKAGDGEALRASGLDALRERLIRFANEDRNDTLRAAVEMKTARLLGNLRLENDIALRAMQMSVEQLSDCADQLTIAMDGIDRERRRASDLLAGDRKRLVERAREAAERIGDGIRKSILSKLNDRTSHTDDSEGLARDLLNAMVEGFAASFPGLQATVAEDLHSTLEQHVEDAKRIAASIRIAASSALGIDLGTDDARIDADLQLKPAWYDRRIETLSPVSPAAFGAVLPRALRRRAAAKRIRKDLDAALTRNIETLRWSLQQAVEESVRSFQSALDVLLNALKASTADAVALAVQRRREHRTELSDQIAARVRARTLLDDLSHHDRIRSDAAANKGSADGT